MGIVDRVRAERSKRLSWPVGEGSVPLGDRFRGHDDEKFSPESYGDYLVTSNEVFAAANLRARQVSRLDLTLYQGRDAEKETIRSGPVADLFRHVNPFWSFRRLLRMDELSMCVWGESFWAIERRDGVPSEIWWCKPSRMRVVPHERDYIAGFLYEPLEGGPQIPFTPDEIVWFRYPNPLDEFSALSPIAAARLAADTGSAMMQSNRNLFRQGLQMGGLVTPKDDRVTFDREQARELEEMLERRFKGVDKSHKWAVLRFEAQMQGLSVSPKDAEFVSGLNLTLRQVASAYGIPAPLLNDMEHATLANAREFKLMLWEDTLQADSDLRASEIEEQLLPMFGRRQGRRTVDHVEWDYSQVPALQASESEMWGREREAIESGRSTINEIRKRHGEPPVPWGDVWWAPVNKAPVEDEDSAPQGQSDPSSTSSSSPSSQQSRRIPAMKTQRFLEESGLSRHEPLALPAVNGHVNGNGGSE